jgi:hypothetical protein
VNPGATGIEAGAICYCAGLMHATRQLWCGAAAIAVMCATASTAAAQAEPSITVQADAVVNAGVQQTTRVTFLADPNAQPGDVPATSTTRPYTEVRPTLVLQGGVPRLTWRAGYTLSANLGLSAGDVAYGNQLNAGLAAELTPQLSATVTAAASQGGTTFLLTSAAAQDGQAQIRAPGNPALVTGTATEAVNWQVGRQFQVRENAVASVSAPQDQLAQRNVALLGTVALERVFTTDILGIELHAGISWLRPPQMDQPAYASVTNAALARWSRDFSVGWSGVFIGGVEQLYTATGSRPVALLPTGSASVRYSARQTVSSLELSHGSQTNLQVGSVSLADRITARGVVTLDERALRAVSFSVGYLRNTAIGEVAPALAAASGNAIQVDAGFATLLGLVARVPVALSARYSAAYQFGQPGGQDGTLAHVLLVGVAGSWSNANRPPCALPRRGERVDGSDGEGFFVVPTGDDAAGSGTPGTGDAR